MAFFGTMCGGACACVDDEADKDRPPLYLGFDLSTQSVKVVAVDGSLNTRAEASVNFDEDLPQFRTTGGVHRHNDGVTVTAPPLMWSAGIDLALARLNENRFPFDTVVSISVSAQQHGYVLLLPGSREQLHSLNPDKPIAPQVEPCFAQQDCPIWMDSSTAEDCKSLEDKLGGAQVLADVTGSRAYERFTGNQIAKLFRTKPQTYNETERICLVSSYITSLFCGSYAPIDQSDGSGMNLMDLVERNWWPDALEATAPALASKLGPIVPSYAVVGHVSQYFTRRYGFSPHCQVVAGSGDNPNSLAGLNMGEDDVCISLGTSDTIFGCLDSPVPLASEGHVFANPIIPEQFMAMLVYKNGSLTRESVKDDVCGPKTSWEDFNKLLQATHPGNDGNIGFYFKFPEITPTVPEGTYRFDTNGHRVDSFPAAAEARALIEGQFLSMRTHANNIGLSPKRILATGGGSVNTSILQIMSDIFGVPVIRTSQPNSASLGAAYRALHGAVCHEKKGEFVAFDEVISSARGAHDPSRSEQIDPNHRNHRIYNDLMEKYKLLEKRVIDSKV